MGRCAREIPISSRAVCGRFPRLESLTRRPGVPAPLSAFAESCCDHTPICPHVYMFARFRRQIALYRRSIICQPQVLTQVKFRYVKGFATLLAAP